MVAFAAFAAVAAGCSSEPEPSTPSFTTSSGGAAAATTPADQGAPVPTGDGVSPGGVTTSVAAAAESLEEEYFQACFTARTWMDAQGGDPRALIEPYLATVQSEDSAGPGTFGTPWSQLTPGRQAAVIVAVEAAADALCG